jgi:hypothetical protein
MRSLVAAPLAGPERSMIQRWMDWLTEQGYQPRLELHGDHPNLRRLPFRLEGVKHCLYLDASDPSFYDLALCYLLGDRHDASSLALLEAANEVQGTIKCIRVKVVLESRAVCFDFEGLNEELPTPAAFARMLHLCRSAADYYFAIIEAPRPPVLLS